MKKLFLVTFLTSVTLFGQNKTDLQKAKMNGQIKSIHTIEYKATKDAQKGEKFNEMTTAFNTKGNFTEMKVINELVQMTFKTSYDNNDNFIAMESINTEGKVTSKNESKYNEKGLKVEDITKMPDGTVFQRMLFTYNDKGYEVERKMCGISDNSCSEKIISEYDQKGNVVLEKTVRVLGGRMIDKSTYKYDEKGNKTEWLSYNERDELMEKTVYKYDTNNNEIEVSLYDAFDVLEEKKTYKYTYDKQNNWTQKIEYINGTPNSISEQTIVYY